MPKASSINADEISRFAKLADRWWDARGPMRPLHQMKLPRLRYIKMQAEKHLGKSLKSLRAADIGCGAGIMSEALAMEGADVLGLDASEELIQVARAHGKNAKNLSYWHGTVEELAEGKEKFDLVLALEVIEHVNDPAGFVKNGARLLNKNGLLIFSTLNRTPKSFLTAIVGAEYLLRVIPRGTHDWRKFLKPSELAALMKAEGLTVQDITGLVFNPFNGMFSLDEGDVSVDYLLTAL